MKPAVGSSITQRLTLLFATVSAIVLLLLGFVVASLAEKHFEELDMELMTGKLELVRHMLAQEDDPANLSGLKSRLDDALVGHHGLSVRIARHDASVIFLSADADLPKEIPSTRTFNQPEQIAGQDGRPLRALTSRIVPRWSRSDPLSVEVATDLSHHEMFMSSFRNALWIVVGFAVVLSGLLGWFAAFRGLSPLRSMARNTSEITATRLNQRLSVEAIPPELADVATTINQMLERLEESFKRLSEFSSDLAHELRTPLANLLTQTQVTLSRARTTAEYQELLASNAEELERLSRTISDMMFLAKADRGLGLASQHDVDLRAQAESLASFYDALASESHIEIAIVGNCVVHGDQLMLRRAIGNLLSNALRHTPPGGRVTIRLAQSDQDSTATVAVENAGSTIPAEHLPRLFDRFYRVDPSRQRHEEGAGLGLAITKSIVEAHGGKVSVSSENGITEFRLILPGIRAR